MTERGAMRMRARARIALLLGFIGLTACVSNSQAPIEQQPAIAAAATATRPPMTRAPPRVSTARDEVAPPLYVVASGDTLLTIAWRYGLDYRDLIRWNQISNPDLIKIGKTLRLRAPQAPTPALVSSKPLAPAPAPETVAPAAGGLPPGSSSAVTSRPPAVGTAVAVVAPPSAAAITSDDHSKILGANGGANATNSKEGLRWMWPTLGKVSAADADAVTKGIDIRGTRAQPVKAAAAGTVVYSGSGLRGYGELIIIKHSDMYLSAYAHNEARLVQEGRHVDAGDTIARMGNSDNTDVMLHFEIRRNGKAVDPLQYLPNR